MRTRNYLCALVAATSMVAACTDGTGTPTGPSTLTVSSVTPAVAVVVAQQFPSLTGRWRATGSTVFRNLDTGNALNWGNCSGSFIVTQDGPRFTGPLNTQGSGANSDRFCTASGTFTGELAGVDAVVAKAELEGNFQNWPRPAVSPSCELISAGDGIWTGSATDDALRLQVRDTLRCPANVDGGLLAAPMTNFERTVSLVFQR